MGSFGTCKLRSAILRRLIECAAEKLLIYWQRRARSGSDWLEVVTILLVAPPLQVFVAAAVVSVVGPWKRGTELRTKKPKRSSSNISSGGGGDGPVCGRRGLSPLPKESRNDGSGKIVYISGHKYHGNGSGERGGPFLRAELLGAFWID